MSHNEYVWPVLSDSFNGLFQMSAYLSENVRKTIFISLIPHPLHLPPPPSQNLIILRKLTGIWSTTLSLWVTYFLGVSSA